MVRMGSWDWPGQGVVFWPVGNGDAVTVVVDDDTFVQFDINHRDLGGYSCVSP